MCGYPGFCPHWPAVAEQPAAFKKATSTFSKQPVPLKTDQYNSYMK